MVKSVMLTLPLLLAAAGSVAPPPLTLEEAAALAAGAPAVARAEAGAERSRGAAAAARARLGPRLAVDFKALTTNNPVDVFALTLQQERFSLADFAASDPNHPGYLKDWSADVIAEWDVDLFGSTRRAADSAAAAAQAADRSSRWMRRTSALDAVGAFVSASRAESGLRLLAERESDAEKDAAIAESLFAQGFTTAADPARARAAVAEVRAQIAEYRAALEQARAALSARIGPEAASRPLAALPQPAAAGDSGKAARDDVEAADLAAEAAHGQERAASLSRWPSLLVQGTYQLHAPAPGGRWGDSATAFAGFRLPLFASGGTNARIAEARAAALEADAAAREARTEGDRQAASARAALSAAEAREAAFREAAAAAGKAREVQQARYEEGVARLADLLEARAAELRAGLGVLGAGAERVVAAASLRLALGLPPVGEEKP